MRAREKAKHFDVDALRGKATILIQTRTSKRKQLVIGAHEKGNYFE